MQYVNSDLINLFFELVKIDSPSGDEKAVGDFVEDYLQDLKLKPLRDKKGNIFVSNSEKGSPILVSAHLDTVEPGRGVKPLIKDGYITSSGDTILGADNKVSVAAILHALRSVDKSRSVEVLFTVSEETVSGIKDFEFSKIKSRNGLIADRSDRLGTIVLASPFIENINIEVVGKGSHAGLPEMGINALTGASNAISKIRWGRIDADTTSNLGLIEGGTAMNSIPGNVNVLGEVRSFEERKLVKQISLIKRVFIDETSKIGATFKMHTNRYCDGYKYDKNDEELGVILEIYKKLKLKPNFQTAFGGSDANYFAKKGIKVVNIGDGSEYSHTTNERVSISNLVKLSEVFIEYIKA